mmetsp:Transcript_26688/g.56587  ORF Transcript_26688/g.56587 Transcript_26688/m.56587 type:complete len:228 (-) Transcript_26688:1721-2404(-)
MRRCRVLPPPHWPQALQVPQGSQRQSLGSQSKSQECELQDRAQERLPSQLLLRSSREMMGTRRTSLERFIIPPPHSLEHGPQAFQSRNVHPMGKPQVSQKPETQTFPTKRKLWPQPPFVASTTETWEVALKRMATALLSCCGVKDPRPMPGNWRGTTGRVAAWQLRCRCWSGYHGSLELGALRWMETGPEGPTGSSLRASSACTSPGRAGAAACSGANGATATAGVG